MKPFAYRTFYWAARLFLLVLKMIPAVWRLRNTNGDAEKWVIMRKQKLESDTIYNIHLFHLHIDTFNMLMDKRTSSTCMIRRMVMDNVEFHYYSWMFLPLFEDSFILSVDSTRFVFQCVCNTVYFVQKESRFISLRLPSYDQCSKKFLWTKGFIQSSGPGRQTPSVTH